MAKKARRSKFFKKWTSSPSEAAFRGGQASPFHYSRRSHIVELFTILSDIFTRHFILEGKNASGKPGKKFSWKFLPALLEALFPAKYFEIFCPSQSELSCKNAKQTCK